MYKLPQKCNNSTISEALERQLNLYQTLRHDNLLYSGFYMVVFEYGADG
jgi:hypothetical protein